MCLCLFPLSLGPWRPLKTLPRTLSSYDWFLIRSWLDLLLCVMVHHVHMQNALVVPGSIIRFVAPLPLDFAYPQPARRSKQHVNLQVAIWDRTSIDANYSHMKLGNQMDQLWNKRQTRTPGMFQTVIISASRHDLRSRLRSQSRPGLFPTYFCCCTWCLNAIVDRAINDALQGHSHGFCPSGRLNRAWPTVGEPQRFKS